MPVKPEVKPKKEVKPKLEQKPKIELDNDGDQPMFTLKKKKKAKAPPAPSPLSEVGSDDDEPAEPPPPRSAFPQWLKAREDAGDAPPLDPDQRRACDCIVVQSIEAIERLEPSLDIEEEQPHVLHWQTKKPSVAREEFGGHGVGSTTKGKGGKCFKCQQVGHWAAECPN